MTSSVVTASIAAGAHSFLRKDEAPETFHQAVRVVAAGNTLFSLESLREIVGRERRTVPAPALRSLTAREREVLVEVAGGLSNDEIAARLEVSPLTVKTHINRLLTKLAARDRAQLVMTAYETGLVRPRFPG